VLHSIIEQWGDGDGPRLAGPHRRPERQIQHGTDLYRELARLQGRDNAFPEELLSRGKQIFATARKLAAEKICADPHVRLLLNDSGPRTSETLTITPLLFNVLPAQGNHEASVALIAILIVRMGLGTFCRRYGAKA
jgi:hypothetical protein